MHNNAPSVKQAALGLAVLLAAACSKQPIVYPSEGDHGINLLDHSVTSATSETDYSFRVELPNRAEFEVTLTLLSEIPSGDDSFDGLWGVGHGNYMTWTVTEFDFDSGSQHFVATPIQELEPGVADLRVNFFGTGEVRFDYFERDDQEPTFVKSLTWE